MDPVKNILGNNDKYIEVRSGKTGKKVRVKLPPKPKHWKKNYCDVCGVTGHNENDEHCPLYHTPRG